MDVPFLYQFLAIRELFEPHEKRPEFILRELVPKRHRLRPQRVPPRMLAEHEIDSIPPHRVGAHDLVRQTILDYPILVYPRLVRKSVGANDRLVGRHVDSDALRHKPRSRRQLSRLDARVQTEVRLPGPERHHYFLERGITRALADAVDGAFGLSRARANARQRVGDGQPEIIVTIRGNRRALHPM